MWNGGISDGTPEGAEPHAPEFPAPEADLEQRLYDAIRAAGESGGSDAEAFLSLTAELASRVARHLLGHFAELLDPMSTDAGASAAEVAQVIQGLWYETLFSDKQAWRRVQSPDAGGRPSAYLWETAKHHLLVREGRRHQTLEEAGIEADDGEGIWVPLRSKTTPRQPLEDERAWEYVRRTDSLSESASNVAQEILPESAYQVWHRRIWGHFDSGDPMTFAEIGRQLGISEDAARKRFHRAENRVNEYIRSHPDDRRARELVRLRNVAGLRDPEG